MKKLSGLRFNRLSPWLLGLAAAAFIPASAHAALVIVLNDVTDGSSATFTDPTTSALPSTTYTIADGTLGGGNITYQNVEATSNSPGTASFARVNLASADLTNNTGAPITVKITVGDTSYSAPGGPGSTLSLLGSYAGTYDPTASGSVQMSSYADALNGANASSSPTASTSSGTTTFNGSFVVPNSFSGGTPPTIFARSATSPGLYSLAGITTLVLNPGGTVDLSDNSVTFAVASVPEPTSLALLGMGSFFLFHRRRRNA